MAADHAWAGPLRHAVIEITNRCDMHCQHCASSSGRAREAELSSSELLALVADIASLGGEEVTILGGEALLREDWREICRAVGERGMDLVLISNGLRLAADASARAELKALRPKVIGISIDGATRDSYRARRGVDAFDDVTELCHRLRADGHDQVNVITTLHRNNLGEIDHFVELLRGTGINWQLQIANKGGDRFDDSLFLTVDDYRWLVDKLRQLLLDEGEKLRLCLMDDIGYFPLDPALRFMHDSWAGCIAGRELIGVRANGDLLGCLSLGDDFVEANIRRAPLPELWRSATLLQRFRRSDEALHGHCERCPHGPECRAGCSAMAHSASGRLGCNPYCIRWLETRALLGELKRARDG